MSALEAVFLGIIQGLAEFLPISSSGHLAFFHKLLGNTSEPTMSFDILLHLGTLAAVCIVYYRDIWKMIRSFFTLCGKLFGEKFKIKNIKLSEDEKFLLMICVAVLPLVVGALIDDWVEAARNYIWVIGLLWIFNGFLLYFSDKICAAREKIAAKDGEDGCKKSKTIFNAFKVGLFQLLAIFPGISRSGMTITGGLLSGFDREFATKFSFILSIPAILGANILELKEFGSIAKSDVVPYICGVVAALISGLLAIKLLNYISKKKNFRIFSVYCAVLGIVAIALHFVI